MTNWCPIRALVTLSLLAPVQAESPRSGSQRGAALVETVQPVAPAFIREDFNPVLGFRIVIEGGAGAVKLEEIGLP